MFPKFSNNMNLKKAMSFGVILDHLGLTRPVGKCLRYLTEEKRRRSIGDIRRDVKETKRDVGAWAGLGSEFADPRRLFGIISFTYMPQQAKSQCLIAKAMQLRGYTPVIFTHSSCRRGYPYFRLFGIDRLVIWDRLIREIGPTALEVEQILSGLLPAELTVPAIMDVQFHHVQVGKHALSMTCRERVEGRLNLNDRATKRLFTEQLGLAVQSVLVAEKFLDDNPLQKLLVRDAGYTPKGAIYETALNRGVDCVVTEFGQRRSTLVYKRHTLETKGLHYFSLSSCTWERIRRKTWTDDDDARLEREFAGRYRPDSTDDTRRLQSNKQLKSPGEVRSQLGLDQKKKTAVIFSHLAWDAAFFYGNCLFDDFEDWLYQTVRFAATECPHLNWIVKVHPYNVFKMQRETVLDTSEIRLLRPLMPLPKHVHILLADTDINTKSLFNVVDYALTVCGTVGMEFPCYGIPAIVAGTGRYNGCGFTVEPETRGQYFTILKMLHTMPRLSTEMQQTARKYFYNLIVGKQVPIDDIAHMELKKVHEAQSDVHDNLHIRARSLEQFQTTPSMIRLTEWLDCSDEPDLLCSGF